MKPPASRLSSWLLLGGILTGFLGATWQGHRASSYSKPDRFTRFHQRISLDALYYPPYAMLETLALARWSPGKTLVIIGGNSIMNGVGQPVGVLWSRRLQELLGDSYVVVNLAFRAAGPVQGGALVAESLLRRGYPVLYVANTTPLAGPGRAPGGFYGYFYWQALYQTRLAPFAARQDAIERWVESLPPGERAREAETRLGARLESLSRHQSLWHHIGYRHVFTVWHPLLAGNFWVPRAGLPDNEPPARPLRERFQDFLPEEMAIVRGSMQSLAVPAAPGQWAVEAGNRQRLDDDLRISLLPALRPRTLVLLIENAPYYRDLLDPVEKEQAHFVQHAFARLWRDHGVACEVAGEDFTSLDYVDRAHLSGSGGRKLAELVARKIQELPRR